MAAMKEIVVAASSVDSPLMAWDLNSGKQVANYKPVAGQSMASGRNSMCAVGTDYVASSQLINSGGAIFFWLWSKSQSALRSFLVEAIGPVACSNDGALLAGGGQLGRVYLWEVSSGHLLRSWSAHYKAVSALVFSDDDSLIISGGEDTLVNVWPVVRMLDSANDPRAGGGESRAVSPMYSWADHSQPVTGLFAGSGGSSAVVVSCSADHTCKFYSLSLGALLRSIVFPVSINAALMDPGEYCLYAGGSDGRIFITSLNYGGSASVGGNSGQDDALLDGHKRAVTALAFSMDSILLISASEDCSACVWDTASKKMLRKFQHPKGPITSILVVPMPSQMPSSSSQEHSNNKKIVSVPVANLHKYPLNGTEKTSPNSPWEGPPVVLPSYLGIEGGPFEADDWTGPCNSKVAIERHMEEVEGGNSVSGLQVALEKKRGELRKALDLADGWRDQFEQSFQIAADLIKYAGNDKEGEAGGMEGSQGKGKSVSS